MTRLRRAITGSPPVLLVLAVVLGLITQSGGGWPTSTRLTGVPVAAIPFTISGSVAGLYPGAHLPLTLTIQNAAPYAETVTSVVAAVGNSDHAGCGAANVSVTPFSGTLVVPASSTRTVALTANMGGAAPNACQGATFPLTYTGAGFGADQPASLVADPIILKLTLLLPQLTLGHFTATMTIKGTSTPIVGKTITFRILNTVVCQAVTGTDGKATCGGLFNSLQATLALSYQASFAADSEYAAVSATGQLVLIRL